MFQKLGQIASHACNDQLYPHQAIREILDQLRHVLAKFPGMRSVEFVEHYDNPRADDLSKDVACRTRGDESGTE